MRLTPPFPVILGSFALLIVNVLIQPLLGTIFISLAFIGVGITYFILRLEEKPGGWRNSLVAVLYMALILVLVWFKAGGI